MSMHDMSLFRSNMNSPLEAYLVDMMRKRDEEEAKKKEKEKTKKPPTFSFGQMFLAMIAFGPPIGLIAMNLYILAWNYTVDALHHLH